MWDRFSTDAGNPEYDAARPRPAAPRRPDAPAPARFAWQGRPEAAACDAAARNLFQALPARLTMRGRVHPETCLAAIGAIAGFCAQRALFDELRVSRNVAVLKQLRTAKTRTGNEYYFGEPLNRMLVPASDAESTMRLWSLAVAGAINAGLSPSSLPDLGEMFAHVATTLVGASAGWPSVEAAHQPHMNGKQALQVAWPVAMDCFRGRLPGAARGRAAPLRHWPAIAGRVAGIFIQRTPAAVHPRTALVLVMESAIYASKVKPKAAAAA